MNISLSNNSIPSKRTILKKEKKRKEKKKRRYNKLDERKVFSSRKLFRTGVKSTWLDFHPLDREYVRHLLSLVYKITKNEHKLSFRYGLDLCRRERESRSVIARNFWMERGKNEGRKRHRWKVGRGVDGKEVFSAREE